MYRKLFFRIVFVIYFLGFVFRAKAQEFPKIDSLKDALKNCKIDTTKILLLVEIANEFNLIDPDSTENYAIQAIYQSKKMNYKKGQAKSYMSMGNWFSIRREYDSSLVYFNKSLKIYTETNDHMGMIFSLNNIGIDLIEQGLNGIATEKFDLAYKISKEYKLNKGLIATLQNMGDVERDAGNYSKSLQYYTEVLTLQETENNQEDLALTLNSIGLLHNLLTNYNKAVDYINRAAKIFEEQRNYGMTAMCYTNLGMVYGSKKDKEKAKFYLKKAIEIYQQKEDEINIGGVYINLGMLHYQFLQYDSSLIEYQKALLIFEKNDEIYGKVLAMNNISSSYNKINNPDSAIHFAEIALKLAIEIESKDDMKESYINLYESFEKKKNFEKSLLYFKRYTELKDSILNIDNVKKLTSVEMQYQMDKKQRVHDFEQKQKEEELEKQRLMILFVVIGLVLMCLVAYQFFRSKRIEQKANLQLTQQNVRIMEQKGLIEVQHAELEHQHELVLHQKEEITSSIVYAKRIQSALLPSEEHILSSGVEYFIYFKPLSIVSGDFYWLARKDNLLFTAAADCTGHGVPGAFMSMLGLSFINEIVNQFEIYTANEILIKLRKNIIGSLKQTGKEGESKDGMDIAFTVLNLDTLEMQYAGAYNPLYIYRNQELIQVKADRMPIGIHIKMNDFNNNIIQMQKGDMFYLFSDGYHDQMGGLEPEPKKLMTKGYQRILQNIHLKPMEEQKQILENEIVAWLGINEQIDDITVIGVRI